MVLLDADHDSGGLNSNLVKRSARFRVGPLKLSPGEKKRKKKILATLFSERGPATMSHIQWTIRWEDFLMLA